MPRPTLQFIRETLRDPRGVFAEQAATGMNPDGTPYTLPTDAPAKDAATQPGTAVAVGSANTAVVAANAARSELTLANDSDAVIYIRLAAAGAVLNSGIRLNAAGGSYTTQKYRGAVCAIQADAVTTKRLLVTEV